jgi:outer membrane protein TolC
MQMFPWLGTLEARTDAAAAAAKAAGQRYQAEFLDLARRVKQSFYEYAYLARAAEIARANLDLLRSFEQVAQSRYRVAVAAHPDVIRAQIELAEMEDALVSVEQMRRPASAELRAILNRPTDVLLPWPVRDQADLVSPDTEKISQLLAQSNPELKAIRFDAISARHEVDLADKRFYPDIGVGVEWMFLDGGESSMSGNDRDPIALMFSINLPIWRDSYRDKASQARSQVVRIRRQEQQRANDLAAEAAKTVYDLEDSRRKAVLYSSVLVPKAREMIRASEDAYRSGNLDFMSLIDAQRKQLMYELAYERSLTSHLQQRARLEQLLGGEIPDKIQP